MNGFEIARMIEQMLNGLLESGREVTDVKLYEFLATYEAPATYELVAIIDNKKFKIQIQEEK